jgi:hypothetical protein
LAAVANNDLKLTIIFGFAGYYSIYVPFLGALLVLRAGFRFN